MKKIGVTERAWLDRAIDLIGASLSQWEDEEDSVQEEHAELIQELNSFLTDWKDTTSQ